MKKLNWGHGIFIAISIMVLAILTMVIKLSNERIDLVADDYYPKGIQHETQLEKQRLTAGLKSQLTIFVDDSVSITFPHDFEVPDSVKGEIWFYKASDKRDDIKKVIDLNNSHTTTFPINNFSYGRYEVIIEWSYQGNLYYFKESIFIEKE
jgi:hypothetical protein